MRKIMDKPENIFLILASIFIGITIFLMPLNRVPDEMSHARMTWEIVYENNDDTFNWSESIDHDSKVKKTEYVNLFKERVDFSKEKFRLYFPLRKIMDIPQLIGMLLGKWIYPSVGVIVTLGRVFNALFYIIGVYLLIKFIQYGKYALTFISLLPIMVQQAASLSYDVMNYFSIVLFFVVLSQIARTKIISKKIMIYLLVSIFLLYVTKKNNVILVILIPFLDIHLPKKFVEINNMIDKVKEYVRKYKYIFIFICLILVFVISIFYFKNKGGVTNFAQVMLNTIFNNNLNGHLNTILSVGMFGFLGNFQIQLPLWLIFIDISVLTLMFTQKSSVELNKGFGVFSGLMLPLHSLLIIAGMYFAWTPVVLGENAAISVGAQGRYFTPFLIYLYPLFSSFKHELGLFPKESNLKKILYVTLISNFVIMVYLILLTYWYPDQQGDWLINFRKNIGR